MKKADYLFTRRDFLRGLSIGAAGLVVGPGIGRVAELLAQNSGRKLGVAMLGLGGYATNQLGPALRETRLCELTAVITGHPEKGPKWAADYNLKPGNIYTYDTMDRIADNRDIDIVYVVTPPGFAS